MADMTLQEKRREWGRKYREQKKLNQQKEIAKASKGPVVITVIAADGTERRFKYDEELVPV